MKIFLLLLWSKWYHETSLCVYFSNRTKSRGVHEVSSRSVPQKKWPKCRRYSNPMSERWKGVLCQAQALAVSSMKMESCNICNIILYVLLYVIYVILYYMYYYMQYMYNHPTLNPRQLEPLRVPHGPKVMRIQTVTLVKPKEQESWIEVLIMF